MDSQEFTSLVVTVQIERMTVDLFAFWLKRDWSVIKGSIHMLDPNMNSSRVSYESSTLVSWSENNPKRFNRFTSIYWVQLRSDEISVRFDAVGNESDLSFNNFDLLSWQLLAWLKRRFGIDVEGKAKVEPSNRIPFEHLPIDDQERITRMRRIIEAKQQGRDYKVSCGLEGVSEGNFRKWRKKYSQYL